MLKNVTITLEEEAARWVRIKAAEENTSVSKYVGKMIERGMRGSHVYWESYERWKQLVAQRDKFGIDTSKRMTREEAHERHPRSAEPNR